MTHDAPKPLSPVDPDAYRAEGEGPSGFWSSVVAPTLCGAAVLAALVLLDVPAPSFWVVALGTFGVVATIHLVATVRNRRARRRAS